MIKPPGPWYSYLLGEMQAPYYQQLEDFLDSERREKVVIYPEEGNTFRALELVAPSDVRVVIVGQDPYPQPGSANGLAFASQLSDKKLPASLKNIYKALKADLGITRLGGNLNGWAYQGVLLLNSVLTVESCKPGSHTGIGWEMFTDYIINRISKQLRPTVFMLWGEKAKEKKEVIEQNPAHIILETSHPSPLSVHRGFLWAKHFSQANQWLRYRGEKEIDWSR